MDHCKYVEVYRRIREGGTIRTVAAECGISRTETYLLCAPVDVIPRRRRRPITIADVAEIESMAADGEVSVHAIAEAVGRPWHTVKRILEARRIGRQVRKYRCSKCGNIGNVTPCMVCEARNGNAATS